MTKTAFFYAQPTLLDREQHKQVRVKPLSDVRFAQEATSVPLLQVEFAEACLEYPIVFVKGADDKWMAVAVTGLRAGENQFVSDEGRWTGRYVPASVRRYPFVLADLGRGDDQFGVAIDMGCDAVAPDLEDGLPLFEASGEPAPVLQTMLQLLGNYQTHSVATHELVQRLADAGVLVETQMEVKGRDGQVANLVGSWVVNESRLRALSDEQVLALFRGGDLALIYAHLLSLRNLIAMLDRQPRAATH